MCIRDRADGKSNRFTMHLLRAESPGPTVGKLAPRMRDTALILYLMYIGLTGLNFIFLIIGKMPVFDEMCIRDRNSSGQR